MVLFIGWRVREGAFHWLASKGFEGDSEGFVRGD